MISGSTLTIIIIAVASLMVLGMVVGLLKRYVRCSADELLVVSGKVKGGSSSSVTHGGAKFVWPVIQEYEKLSLNPMQIEIDLKGALSNQNIRVDVPSAVTFSISNEEGVMQNAATHLLGLNRSDIQGQASDIIFGQMRQVISNMSIEEINSNRDLFIGNIQKNLSTELAKIGLKLINVNVKDIRDESGYIDAIGKEAAAKAINEANIKVAEETKKGEIGSNKADRVRRTEVAAEQAQAEIGEKEAERDKRTNVAEANARAVEGENKSKEEIATSNARLAEVQADADRRTITAQKVQSAKAEAEGLKQERITEEERAKKVEASLKADKIVPAEIEKTKVIIGAQAERGKIFEIAQGEADAKFAMMEAEAKGIYEILSKTADGFSSIVNACGGDVNGAVQMMLTDKMPELMGIQMEAIKGIDIDKITVWDNGGNGNGTGNSTSNFIQEYLKSAPQLKSIYNMVGDEFPKMLQGAAEIANAENEGKKVVEVDDTDTNSTASEEDQE